jgi:hypothetical protein
MRTLFQDIVTETVKLCDTYPMNLLFHSLFISLCDTVWMILWEWGIPGYLCVCDTIQCLVCPSSAGFLWTVTDLRLDSPCWTEFGDHWTPLSFCHTPGLPSSKAGETVTETAAPGNHSSGCPLLQVTLSSHPP